MFWLNIVNVADRIMRITEIVIRIVFLAILFPNPELFSKYFFGRLRFFLGCFFSMKSFIWSLVRLTESASNIRQLYVVMQCRFIAVSYSAVGNYWNLVFCFVL